MIRVWAVSAVTPFAKVLETLRSRTMGIVQGYITLHDTREDNLRMKAELDKLKMQNQFLKTQLETADRAKALIAFQSQTQSRTLAARIIGLGAGFNSKVVFVDRGSKAGVEKGMAVVTPDGIVGKVLAAYPTASQVMLITDPNFAAGVISQKNHARGTVKGRGNADCAVEYIQNEQKVDVGEWFYTSGDDRIFPKGFPVGVARVVRPGQTMKDIFIEPSGLQHGLDEVLILTEGVHQAIPDTPPPANEPVYMTPAPPAPAASAGPQDNPSKSGIQTDADRLRERYKEIGDAQGHKFGEGLPGSKPPDFNIKLPAGAAAGAPKPATATSPPSSPPVAAPAPASSSPSAAPVTAGPRPEGSPAPRKPAAPAPQQEQPPKPSKPVDPFL
jgi:rod shape-determining protein MreC